MSLSPQALDAALRPLEELLEPRGPAVVARVPVAADDWGHCLHDARIGELPDRLTEVQVSLARLSGPSVTYSQVRAAAGECRRVLQPILASVESLAAFVPAGGPGADLAGVVSAVVDESVRALRHPDASGAVQADVTDGVNALVGVFGVVSELSEVVVPTTGVWASFGIDDDIISGWPVAVACARLLDAFHGRYGELSERLGAVMEPVSSMRIDLVKEARNVLTLVESPRPFITLRTARAVKALIVDAFDADPVRTGSFLVELLTRVGRSYENQQAAGKVRALLASAAGPRERAVLELDLYRRMAEGQVRPWAWTIARLLRGGSNARLPEMGPLREMLFASGHWLAADAARLLRPDVRNAAAHEDYSWNPESQRLEFDGGIVGEEELRTATLENYAFMCGAELGWSYAREERPALGVALNVDPGPTRRSLLNSSDAAAHFGSNGIRLQRFEFSANVVSATVSGLEPSGVNSCFQAMMWVSELMPGQDAVEVLVEEQDGSLLVRREAFEMTMPLWASARRWFDYMPPSVFLPAHVDNRLRVETVDEAARAAVWFTTNCALKAYDEFEQTVDVAAGLSDLARKLALAERSLFTTTELLLPESTRVVSQWPLRLVSAAAVWARSAAAGDDPGPLSRLRGRIGDARDRVETPKVAPTLWPDATPDGISTGGGHDDRM